ncbi:hypothetical protein V8F20_010852 [Naviculisporaceae sp. PSN 640]
MVVSTRAKPSSTDSSQPNVSEKMQGPKGFAITDLNIGDSLTCMGIAKATNQPCKLSIPEERRNTAKSLRKELLLALARNDVKTDPKKDGQEEDEFIVDAVVASLIVSMALVSLCHHHKHQVDSVFEQWATLKPVKSLGGLTSSGNKLGGPKEQEQEVKAEKELGKESEVKINPEEEQKPEIKAEHEEEQKPEIKTENEEEHKPEIKTENEETEPKPLVPLRWTFQPLKNLSQLEAEESEDSKTGPKPQSSSAWVISLVPNQKLDS